MPSSAVRTFTDPDAYFAGIRNLRIDGVVTRRGDFRAEATRIDLHRLWMHRFEEKLPRIMNIQPSGSRVLILFSASSEQPMLANGIETSPGQIVMFGLRWPYYLRSSASIVWGTISLVPEDLAAAGQAIIGQEVTPPAFMRPIRAQMSFYSQLLKLHEATGLLAKTAPDILARPEVARAMEHALVEALVLCLAADHSDEARKVHCHPATVIRRLEQALEASAGEPLYMADVCTAVGVSYWVLRDCCREYLGMGPKRYLWMRRMHLARRALRSADAESTNVTEIATNYGFWELGRFSVAYRSLFGESPSITLRRPPDSRKRMFPLSTFDWSSKVLFFLSLCDSLAWL